jgi:hypothetical protein
LTIYDLAFFPGKNKEQNGGVAAGENPPAAARHTLPYPPHSGRGERVHISYNKTKVKKILDNNATSNIKKTRFVREKNIFEKLC